MLYSESPCIQVVPAAALLQVSGWLYTIGLCKLNQWAEGRLWMVTLAVGESMLTCRLPVLTDVLSCVFTPTKW